MCRKFRLIYVEIYAIKAHNSIELNTGTKCRAKTTNLLMASTRGIDMKVVLRIGQESGGKTCLMQRFIHGKFNTDTPYKPVRICTKYLHIVISCLFVCCYIFLVMVINPYGIPVKLLKLLDNHISHPLNVLINDLFITGIFPSKLKISNVTPLHKKGSNLEPNNYRISSI